MSFLLVGAGAFGASRLMKPLYQSSTLVQVIIHSSANSQASYEDLLASDQLVQTESILATSEPVLAEVASHYPGMTEGQLAGEVSSAPKTNTQIFEISVVDQNPARAASLANDIATTLIQQQGHTLQQDNAQAQRQIQANLNQLNQQIDDITTQIATLQATATAGLAQKADHKQIVLLQTQLDGLQQRYNQGQTSLAQLELAQAQSQNPLHMVQPAQPASSAVQPNVKLNTGGGLLAGLLLGLLLALLFNQLDTRVRTAEDLTNLLEWTVLATVWHTKSAKSEDVINPAGNTINAESYRLLRTNIGFASIDRPVHSLLVTSALRGDGKSSVAANLAIFMARAGKNTLLIDADLRRPHQHALFDLAPDVLGLSNAVLAFSSPATLSQQSDSATLASPENPRPAHFSLAPFVHAVDVPHLHVMPSGPLPPNPSEFLESKVMQRFLKMIAESPFEIVIFDTAPVLGLSDTSILAARVDSALVVIDATHATTGKLKQMKALLARTGVHVLGCVVNKLPHKRGDSAYDYYAEDQNHRQATADVGPLLPPVSVTLVADESSAKQKSHPNGHTEMPGAADSVQTLADNAGGPAGHSRDGLGGQWPVGHSGSTLSTDNAGGPEEPKPSPLQFAGIAGGQGEPKEGELSADNAGGPYRRARGAEEEHIVDEQGETQRHPAIKPGRKRPV